MLVCVCVCVCVYEIAPQVMESEVCVKRECVSERGMQCSVVVDELTSSDRIHQHSSAYVSNMSVPTGSTIVEKKNRNTKKRGKKPEIALIKDFLASLKICVPVFLLHI